MEARCLSDFSRSISYRPLDLLPPAIRLMRSPYRPFCCGCVFFLLLFAPPTNGRKKKVVFCVTNRLPFCFSSLILSSGGGVMYTKNLSKDLRLRLTETDMSFLSELASNRGQSVSEVLRSIIGEYRRSLETLDLLSKAVNLAHQNQKGGLSNNGDTISDFNNQL